MNQPAIIPNAQGSKKCWACPTSIPYTSGFCLACWHSLPLDVQVIYISALGLPEPYGGFIRAAIADCARVKSSTTKPKLSLEDLFND